MSLETAEMAMRHFHIKTTLAGIVNLADLQLAAFVVPINVCLIELCHFLRLLLFLQALSRSFITAKAHIRSRIPICKSNERKCKYDQQIIIPDVRL